MTLPDVSASDQGTHRIEWLDFMKGIAIIAVILDHLFFLFPAILPNRFHTYTFFSVALFVFLAGITSALSYKKHGDADLKGVFARLPHILIPYILATFCFSIYKTDLRFDFNIFIIHLFTFSASSPFYFVFFFIQLMFAAPLLYRIIAIKHKSDFYTLPLFLLLILVISSYSTFYTKMLPLHGGGSKLFGGFFLFYFAFGMLFFRFKDIMRKFSVMLGSFLFFSITYLFLKHYPDFDSDGKYYQFFVSANPPGLLYFVYTSAVFFGGLTLFSMLDIIKKRLKKVSGIVEKITAPVNLCGRNSYIIFLFHMLPVSIIGILKLEFKSTWFTAILFASASVIFTVLVSLSFLLPVKLFRRFFPEEKSEK